MDVLTANARGLASSSDDTTAWNARANRLIPVLDLELTPRKPRVCAVSFLNTAPLVWGMLQGFQKDAFELSFAVPSECADRVARGDCEIGLVPCAEMSRLRLSSVPGLGIACKGAVKSILLFSKVAPSEIRTLAADSSSRTSVMLARMILDKRYGALPRLVSHAPSLDEMLADNDAALIIGDPALRLDLHSLRLNVLDLGSEWLDLVGLPMVFAKWSGQERAITPEVVETLTASCEFGLQHLPEIAEKAMAEHSVDSALALRYLESHIIFRLGSEEEAGLKTFLEWLPNYSDTLGISGDFRA
jgi:chorismate dehydratase